MIGIADAHLSILDLLERRDLEGKPPARHGSPPSAVVQPGGWATPLRCEMEMLGGAGGGRAGVPRRVGQEREKWFGSPACGDVNNHQVLLEKASGARVYGGVGQRRLRATAGS